MSGTVQNRLNEAREVCPTTTRRLIKEGALLLDVREPSEVELFAFDVPDVVLIPMSELEQRWSEVPRDRDVVVVCEVGVRSLKATYYLQFHGYTRVSNMGGGIVKWARKGFPVKGQPFGVGSTTTECCGAGGGTAKAESASCCTPSVAAASASSCCGTTDAAATQSSCC